MLFCDGVKLSALYLVNRPPRLGPRNDQNGSGGFLRPCTVRNAYDNVTGNAPAEVAEQCPPSPSYRHCCDIGQENVSRLSQDPWLTLTAKEWALTWQGRRHKVPPGQQQTYQVTRISRETPAFWSHHPHTRRVTNISRISSTKFGQLILSKTVKIVATRCHILRLKFTKFHFGCGSAPDPARELSASQTHGWI